ncbi:hypothetical protein KDK_44430 [Dictyobacter kobayashii]|uniref:Uncharacterized protein n=1 Tax=Dictyobacter kobayashii TaxID=2014872 RepID=A0A402ANA9_9CHLR|nr:hypothetical protein KDK_44430 [Dictyobacter kobayashii]
MAGRKVTGSVQAQNPPRLICCGRLESVIKSWRIRMWKTLDVDVAGDIVREIERHEEA